MIRNESIIEIEGKIRYLITKLETTREEKKNGEMEIERLEERVKTMETEMKEMKQKYETLKLAKSLSGVNAESGDARVKINNIVRELDRCIALLNQ